jgi:nucleoside phosphorylase/tetratricopeptide (TPR) repeat protein
MAFAAATALASERPTLAKLRMVRVPRALLITAIDPEFVAARAHLEVSGTRVDGQGTIYTLGSFVGQSHTWDIALIQVDQGNVRSAVLTTLGVTHFQPDVVLLLGVAGCLKPDDLGLGDVVAGGLVRGYERGKETDEGFQLRSDAYTGAHRLVQAAHQVVHDGHWQRRVLGGSGMPRAVVGTIAAGEKLLNSDRGPVREFLATNVTDAVAVEMEGLGVVTAAHICATEALVIRAISDNLADKQETDKAQWQPIAASHVAAFGFELLAILQWPSSDAVRSPEGVFDRQTVPVGLPSNLQEQFERIAEHDQAVGSDLARALRFPPGGGAPVITELITNPPDWLRGADAAIWRFLASSAEAFEAFAAASVAYEHAGRANGSPRPRWLARAANSAAAAGDQARAAAMIDEAQAIAPDDVFVKTYAAGIRQDWLTVAGLTDRAGLDPEEALSLDLYLAFGLRQQGRFDEAEARLVAAAEAFPRRAIPLLSRADLLLTRAALGSSADRMRDLQTAVDLATEARNRYRLWSGSAVRALLIACRAALAADDADTVLRLALSEQMGGEATEQEASDPQILTLASRAAILAGRDDLQSQLQKMMQGGFSSALIEALRIKRASGQDLRVVDALMTAASLATEPSEVFAVLYHLADVGAELPDELLRRLADIDPEMADVVAARAKASHGDFDGAVEQLRRWSPKSADASRALGHTHAQAGDIDRAIDVFRGASRQFDLPTMLLDAVDVAAAGKRLDEAEELAQEALLRLPEHHPGRAYALSRLVEIAADKHRWRDMEERARLLRRESDSTNARWALTVALHNQTKLDEAWQTLSEEPALEVTDRMRAQLVIPLLSEAAPLARALPWLLDIAERFSDDEEVGGTALLAIAFLRAPQEAIEAYRERLGEVVRRFSERFPTSRIFRMESLAAPEELLMRAESELLPGSEEMFRLEEQVREGERPYGLFTTAAGRPYGIAFTPPGAGFLVALSTSSEQSHESQLAAEASLGREVIADTSAIAVLSQLSGAWTQLRAMFHRVYVTDSAVRDSILARKQATARAAGIIMLDRKTKKAVAVPIPPEDVERHATLTAHLADVIAEANQIQCDALPAFPDLDSPERHLPWLSPIQVAIDRNLVLWSDDAAQRRLAFEMGVKSFGTNDLIEILTVSGRVQTSDVDRWRREMIAARIGDFPLDGPTLVSMASENGWAPGPVSMALSRAATWTDPPAANTLFMEIFRRVAHEAPDLLPFWLAVAIRGSVARIQRSAEALAGGLLSMAIAMAGFNPAPVSLLVEAARQVTKEWSDADPLVPAAASFLKTATELLGPQQGASLTLQAFSQLSETDRRTVADIVIGVALRPQ